MMNFLCGIICKILPQSIIFWAENYSVLTEGCKMESKKFAWNFMGTWLRLMMGTGTCPNYLKSCMDVQSFSKRYLSLFISKLKNSNKK